MKRKKIIILTSVAAILLLVSCAIYLNKPANNIQEAVNNESPRINEELSSNKTDKLALLSALSGLEGNNIQIINNPVGFEGEVFAPAETITNGINYFLKRTKNNKMEDLKISVYQDTMDIRVNYKVIKGIKTPIELKIIPTIDENQNLEITIQAVKLLDLKIPEWIVNKVTSKFVEDWFPKGGEFKVTLNKDTVVIDKENFKGIIIEELQIVNEGLQVKGIIDVEKL